MTEQVVGYLRRRPNGEVLDVIGLDMPRHTLHTRAVWYTIGLDALLAAGYARRAGCPARCTPPSTPRSACCRCSPAATDGTSAGCRRRSHPDTGEPTVIVYDGYPGGAGFADRGHRGARRVARARCGMRSRTAPARPVARPACNPPSAATAITRWTRPQPSPSWNFSPRRSPPRLLRRAMQASVADRYAARRRWAVCRSLQPRCNCCFHAAVRSPFFRSAGHAR